MVDSDVRSKDSRHWGDLAFTRADVEDACGSGQALLRERKNLLFVFRVGPVGESFLPPARVAFPQVVVGHRRRVSA